MSDRKFENLDSADGLAGKHGAARTLAEQALQAEADGDEEKAEELFTAAEKADPDAVIAVLAEHADDPPRSVDTEEQDDDEVAAMTRTVEPGAAAPSRAGVSGRGSGADTQE